MLWYQMTSNHEEIETQFDKESCIRLFNLDNKITKITRFNYNNTEQKFEGVTIIFLIVVKRIYL